MSDSRSGSYLPAARRRYAAEQDTRDRDRCATLFEPTTRTPIVKRRRSATLLLVATFVVAVALRVALSLRPGIWADEVFSLATATGHSVEHPAAAAVPALGDFVEGDGARPAAEWRAYAELGERPASPARVIRAVYLSDTNPPLYYLALNAWARLAGTGDSALRLLSVLWAIAAIPLLWLVGREIGGRRVALAAVFFFALSPAALHYSTEGRMYSMGWFLGLGLALAVLRLRRGGAVLPWVSVAVIAGAAALTTHYFLAFVWLACLGWLALHPGRMPRGVLAAAVAGTLLLVTPWYLQIPETLAAWRVSAGWQDYPLSLSRGVRAPFKLGWSLLGGHGSWGGAKPLDVLLALGWLCIGAVLLRTRPRGIFGRRTRLAWFWILGSIFGLVAFDLLRGTSVSLVSRYAVLGLPAAMLLAAVAVTRFPPRTAVVLAGLVGLAWLSGIRDSFTPLARPHQPFPAIAAHLADASQRPDVVLVHSIPTGVIGLARYLPAEIPLASWIVQLEGRSAPEDLARLLEGHCRAALVKVHDLGRRSPAEEWLRAHALLVDSARWRVEDRWTVAETLHFVPVTSSGLRAGCDRWW
jgi:mannosyltransferase